MCVRPVDQNASSPNQSPLEHQRHLPNWSQEQRRRIQLPAARPGDGTWTEIGNKISQSLRTSGIGYNYGACDWMFHLPVPDV
jgi:hypothetical protein